MNKRVVIDASSALTFGNQFLSGIGRATVELIKAFESMDDLPFDLRLFVQRLSSDRLQKYDFKSSTRTLPLPRWEGLDWVRNRLPTVEALTGADLLHIPNNYAPVFNPKKTIVTIHDAIFLACPEPHMHTPEETRKTVDLARACRAIITDSECSKRDISNYMQIDPEKISVCYLGYDRAKFYVEPDQELVLHLLKEKFAIKAPYFVSVSCSIGRKNSPAVVEQFVKLCKDDGNSDLVMVWRNPSESVLKLVESASLGSRVHFLSGVSDDDLRLLYNGAIATLFPSTYEGFGFPVVESMACGTPVVTCDASSLPEVGGDAAIYIPPGDHDALLAVMKGLLTDQYDLNDLAESGLHQARKFSWEQCAAQTMDVYLRQL